MLPRVVAISLLSGKDYGVHRHTSPREVTTSGSGDEAETEAGTSVGSKYFEQISRANSNGTASGSVVGLAASREMGGSGIT